MKAFLTPILLTLAGCASTPETEFIVMKYTWKYCWEACGKKDNLAAVSLKECICSHGDPVPINPLQKPQKEDKGMMKELLNFLNGE